MAAEAARDRQRRAEERRRSKSVNFESPRLVPSGAEVSLEAARRSLRDALGEVAAANSEAAAAAYFFLR